MSSLTESSLPVDSHELVSLEEDADRSHLNRYIQSVQEHLSGPRSNSPPALTHLLDGFDRVLQPNKPIPLHRKVGERVLSPTPLPNSPPSDLFPVASSSISEDPPNWQGLDDFETSTRPSSPTLSSISDITVTDSEPDDAKFRSNSVRSSVSDYAESYSAGVEAFRVGMCKHDKFYFEDGNILITCEETSFRVHTSILCLNSPVIRDQLSPRNLALADRLKGCLCIRMFDSSYDFSTLLNILYDPGFLERHKTPIFPVYSSILRMTTKYKIQNVRDQLLVDLYEAYPTEFEAYEVSQVLGESIFGNPIPHPNAVLNLFIECSVKFALPYAFYRACQKGVSSLTDTTLGSALPLNILRDAIVGLGRLKEAEWNAAKTILFGPKLKKCDKYFCPRLSSLHSEQNGLPIFQTLFNSITCTSAGMEIRVLETPRFMSSTEAIFCGVCRCSWLASHREAREKVWKLLPTFFALDPLETTNKKE